MVKDLLVIADLGAAGNLVRNLLMLSDQIDWPLPSNRFDTILSQYPHDIDLSQWLAIEYKLRFWQRYYNADLSNNLDFQAFQQRKRMPNPVVYLNHSAFYQLDQVEKFRTEVNILYVAPATQFGIDWQVRSYCEKKTVEKLHNFTFNSEVEQQQKQFCAEHGHDAYYRLNVSNFKDIIGQRQKEFGTPDLTLEMLLSGPTTQIIEILLQHVGISIDSQQAKEVISQWRRCHWPLAETNNWKYYDHNVKY
jgi:hypothetical protein